MSEYTYSVSLIVPAALHEKAQRLAWAIGNDEPPLDSFSAELSSDGTDITHYGLHTYAVPEFAAMLSAAQQGQLPPIPWADYGLTEQDVLDLMGAMTVVAMEEVEAQVTWQQAKDAAGVEVLDTVSIPTE